MKPTHRLKVLDKTTAHKTECGAGWQNKDGSISIVLNPCIVMQHDPNLVFTLFPNTPKED